MSKRSRKRNEIVGKFVLPIYEPVVYVAVADSVADGIKLLPKKFTRIQDKLGEDYDSQACYIGEWPNYALIFRARNLNLGVVAHEVGHVCRRILDEVGFKIESDNDEPLAYLEEYMTNKVHAILSGK